MSVARYRVSHGEPDVRLMWVRVSLNGIMVFAGAPSLHEEGRPILGG